MCWPASTRSVEATELPIGRVEEREPPEQLPSQRVTTLHIYGSLFYAGARTFEESLPSPQGALELVVVLRLRGKTAVVATLVDILADYSEQLNAAGGRLYLSGVDEHVQRQFTRSGKVGFTGPVSVYLATPIVGASSQLAQADAESWLVRHRSDEPRPASEVPPTA